MDWPRALATLTVTIATAAGSPAPAAPQPPTQTAGRPTWVPAFDGPWNHAISILRSDGDGRLRLVERDAIPFASAPTLCGDAGGRLLAFFQFYSRDNEAQFDCLARATSTDGGRTWSPPRPIKLRGLAPADGRPRDPAIVPLSDGKYRLYFALYPNGGRNIIASAVSADGRDFSVEPGRRVAPPDAGVSDPAIVETPGEVHLLARITGRRDVLYHAVSRDGLSFARLPDLRLDAAAQPDRAGRFRLFVARGDAVIALDSDDADLWRLAPRPAVRGALSPAAWRCADGATLLACVSRGHSAANSKIVVTADASLGADGAAARGAAAARPADALAAAEPAPDESPSTEAAADSPQEPATVAASLVPAGMEGGFLSRLPDTIDDELVIDLADGQEASAPDGGEPYSPREFEWPPAPDFQTPVDYIGWLKERAALAVDDANPFYAEVLLTPDESGALRPALPPFVGLASDVDYDGPPVPWNPLERPVWEESFQQSLPFVERFRQAASHRDYATAMRTAPGGEMDGLLLSIMLPELSPHRAMAKQLLSNAWRAPEGRVDSAGMTRTWETVLRSASHLDRGMTLIEQLVGTAEKNLVYSHAREALAQGVFADDELDRALTTLRQHAAPHPDPDRWVAAEVAIAMDLIQHCAEPARDDETPRYDPERLHKAMGWFGETGVDEARVAELAARDPRESVRVVRDYYAQYADLVRQGPPQVTSQMLDNLAEQVHQQDPFAVHVLPSLGRVYTLRTREEATRRATLLSYGVHQFRAQHGHWPDSLDDLPAEHAATVRIDPFSGADFVYRVGDDGPVIYSVSQNGTDDGGIHAPRWGDDAQTEQVSDDYVFWPPRFPRR